MIIDCLSKAIFLYLIYNVVALSLFGVPHSLSMTYYLFKERSNTLRYLFPSMMICMAMFLAPCWLELSKNSDFQFTAFLSIAGMIFVGGSPSFMSSKLESKIHDISAYLASSAAIAWIVLVTPYWYVIPIIFSLFAIIAIATKTAQNCYIFWLENVAIVSTFIAMIMYFENIFKLL